MPSLAAVVERRLLVNYAVDPERIRPMVPERFRLELVDGQAVAGICLIRLGEVRPSALPRVLGLRSENAAHRVAVEWDGRDGPRRGVYILQRHTGSRLTSVAGGRVFPGVHARVRFDVVEDAERLHVAYSRSRDADVDITVRPTLELTGSRLFPDLASASRFFEDAPTGYSPARRVGALDGLRLTTTAWRVEATEIESARSAFFDDVDRFPPGTARLDSALLMRDVPVEWHAAATPA